MFYAASLSLYIMPITALPRRFFCSSDFPMDLPWWLSIFNLFVFPFISTHGYSRLTDMKCKVLNRTKFDISHCSLTNLGHGNVSANVHLNVHQPPDKNWMVSYGIWRDQGGYKPFFHNISLDFCRFLKNPSRLQLYYSFHKAILPFSNLNHSCPYTVSTSK